MAKITIENIYDCYQYGRKIHTGEIEKSEAVKEISSKGMNAGSVKDYLACICAMLDGTVYKSTVNTEATRYFLDGIIRDYGIDRLGPALNAVHQHLEYQRPYQNLNSIRKIYKEYSEYLSKIN